MKNCWHLESKWEHITNNRENKNHRAKHSPKKTMVGTNLAEYQVQSKQVKRKVRGRHSLGNQRTASNPQFSNLTLPSSRQHSHLVRDLKTTL